MVVENHDVQCFFWQWLVNLSLNDEFLPRCNVFFEKFLIIWVDDLDFFWYSVIFIPFRRTSLDSQAPAVSLKSCIRCGIFWTAIGIYDSWKITWDTMMIQ